MSNRILRVVPVLVLLIITYGCGNSDVSPTAPQQLLQTSDAGGASFGTTGKGSKPNKMDICHLDDLGRYRLLNVSSKAWKAHEAHGDGIPGGQVPGEPEGVIFDDDCQFATATCPCFTEAELLNFDVTFGGNAFSTTFDDGLLETLASGRTFLPTFGVRTVAAGQSSETGPYTCRFYDSTASIDRSEEITATQSADCRQMIRDRWPGEF